MATETTLEWHGEETVQRVNARLPEILRTAGLGLLDISNIHCPVDTGRLRSTGAVSVDGTDCYVFYDTEYAVRVHEHPEYNFQGEGQGKWLENAYNANETGIMEQIEKGINEVL